MRTELVQTNVKKEALKECPWASKAVRVFGGYMCFESIDDHNTWKNQK